MIAIAPARLMTNCSVNATDVSLLFTNTPVSSWRWLIAIDPRGRIIAAVSWALTITLVQHFTTLLFTVCIALLSARGGGLAWHILAWRLLILDGVLLLLVVTLPFTMPGEVWWHSGNLQASIQGTQHAGRVLLKANGVVITVLGLIGTMELGVFSHAVSRLGLPIKLVQLLLTVSQLHVLEREYRRLRDAMRMRAFVPRNNWHTWRSLGWLLAMLLLRGIQRGRRLFAAMRCRGFHGHWLLLTTLQWRLRDSGLILLWAALIGVVVIMERNVTV